MPPKVLTVSEALMLSTVPAVPQRLAPGRKMITPFFSATSRCSRALISARDMFSSRTPSAFITGVRVR